MTQQKITPNLWFDGNAREAAEFYTGVFPGSSITGGSRYPGSAEDGLADFQLDLAGKDLTIDVTLAGHQFVFINAGPEFKPTSATSFLVNFDPSVDKQAIAHLNQVWEQLIDGGKALIDIGEHPFSKRYGWVQDKYGYSWQLILTKPDGEPRPCIIPDLLFGDDVQNKAEEAMRFYTGIFEDSSMNILARYPEGQAPTVDGAVMFGEFQLAGQWFAAMDSAVPQETSFNEAVSFSVACENQAEVDRLWEKLSAVPESEQCGWCKDKYGVSWQIVPKNMDELMRQPGAFKTLMQQHKIIIDEFKHEV